MRNPSFRRRALLAAIAVACLQSGGRPSCGQATSATPPAPLAARIPVLLEMHGHKRIDEYFWMRDRNDPRVVAYLEAENAYAERVLEPTEGLQARLYDEIVARLQPDEVSVPVEDHGYFYSTRFEAGKGYPLYCRRKGSPAAAEEVMLDVNLVAAGLKLCKVAGLAVSPDNRFLAYGVDARGDRLYTIHVKDLATGTTLPDEIPGTSADVAWAADSRSFFYGARDATVRTNRVLRHRLGAALTSDRLVYPEDDVEFEVSVRISKSRRFVLIESASTTSSEYRIVDAADARGRVEVFQPRTPNLRYWVEHVGGRFYVRTNLGAPSFTLAEARACRTGKEHWKRLVAYRPEVLLEGFEAFDGYLVLAERVAGLSRLRVLRLADHSDRTIGFDDEAYDAGFEENPEPSARSFRIHYSSPVTPESIIDIDLRTLGKRVIKQARVGGGYDPARYEVRLLRAPTRDGVAVPITVVSRKGIALDGASPLLLYGYGAYGNSRRDDFAPERVSLLDRGFVFAIAHVRGGQELGRAWYEEGKLQHKKNTFADFIACAEYLIAQRFTSPQRMFANGMSAGGMMMAVVANSRPDLFRGITAEVPWTDVVTDGLDTSLPLTTVEYEEWGDPHRKPDYDYVLSYSPYDNVKAQAYPALLVTAAFNDTQVPYWSPAKWVAKLRAMKTDANPLLLVTNMASGHSGASGRLERYRLTALKYAFMLWLLGIDH